MTNNRKLAAIMFTDIEGYTKLMQGNEEQAIRYRTKHRKIFNQLTPKHNGKILQYYGDGTLSIFDSAIEAVNCGIEIQLALLEDPVVPVRIGVHIGDIVHSNEEIIGDGVNVASRIESLAVAGSVFISDQVYDEVKNQPTIQTKRLRRVKLKNVERIFEVYAIANTGLVVPNAEDLNGKTERIPEFRKQKKIRNRIRITVVSALIVIASVSVYKLIGKPGESEVQNVEVAPEPNSIAVLAFENMSGDVEDEYFSDGISEEILNYLAKVDGLKVAGRTSAFAFKGKNEDIKIIGKKLKVGMVLEGSVRKANNRVRITAQLINVADGFHIWSETFDRELEDIFAIQDEIAAQIVEKLKLSLTGTKITEKVNVEAYDLLLKGIHFLNKDFEGTKKGLEYCLKAVQVDSNYATAYACIGDAYINYSIYGFMSNAEAYSKAREAAEKSISINPTEARAHKVLAYVKMNYDWNWEGALNEYNKAIEYGLRDPDHFITLYDMLIRKDFKSSIAASTKILERDALHLQSHWHLVFQIYSPENTMPRLRLLTTPLNLISIIARPIAGRV